MLIKHKNIVYLLFVFLILVVSLDAQNWKKSDPEQKELNRRYKLANHLEKSGRLEDALEIYKYLYNQKPDEQKYLQRYIRLLFKMEKFERMAEVLKGHLNRIPDDLDAWLNLGVAYYKMGNPEKADRHWQKTLDNFDHSQKVYRKLFMQYVQLQEYEKAKFLIQKLRKNKNDDSLMALEMGQLNANQAKYRKAVSEYLKYADRTKRYDYITRLILGFPNEQNVIDKLDSYLDKKIPADSRNIKLLELKEKIHFKYKNFEKATKIAFQVEKTSGYSGKHITGFIQNLTKEKKYDLAENTYYRVLKDKHFSDIHHQALLGIAKISERKIEDHQSSLLDYFYPGNYFFKSYFYYGIEDEVKYLDKAFSIYDSLLTGRQSDKFSAKVNYRLGELSLLATRDFESALNFFRKAYNKSGNYDFRIKCNRRLAHTYLALGETEKALQEIQNILPRLNSKYEKKLLPDLLLMQLYNGHTRIDSLANQALGKLGFEHDYYNDIFELYSFYQKTGSEKGFDDFIRGEIKLRQDKLAEAKNIYNYLTNNYNNAVHEPAHFRNIQLELYFKNYQKAEDLIRKMDSTSIYKGDAIYMLAEVARSQKQDMDMAKQWYQELIVNHPDDINLEKARKKLRELSNN